MCLHGVYKRLEINNSNQSKREVVIDACIYDEIKNLNIHAVRTIACCCGHGETGVPQEYENGFGKWKETGTPPHALITGESVKKANFLGYRAYPYYYADGEFNNTWIIYLKSGCITREDCENWHKKHNLKFEKGIGVIDGELL